MSASEFAALAASILVKLYIPQLDKTYWYTHNAYYPAINTPTTTNPDQIVLANKLQVAATVYNRNLKLRYYCSKPTNKLIMNYLVFTSNSVGQPVDVQNIMNSWGKQPNLPKNWILLKSGPALSVTDVIASTLDAKSIYFMEYKVNCGVKLSQSSDAIPTPISRSTSDLQEMISLTLYVDSELAPLDIVDYVYQWLCIRIGEVNTHKYNKLTVVTTKKTTKHVLACIERYITPSHKNACFLCKLTTAEIPIDYTSLNDINDDWLGNDWVCVGCERACLLWEELAGRKATPIPPHIKSNNVWLQLQQLPRIIEANLLK